MAISEITAAMLLKALDAASLRHQAISSNLANANSVDYRPLRVNFEEQLGFARLALSTRGGTLTAGDVASVRPRMEQEAVPKAGTAAVMIDMEMVKLAQNTLQYQALTKGVTHRSSLIQIAINEGRK